MRNDKQNLIVEKSIQFAVDIIHFTEELEINKKFVIARQLLRCGTSIGANVREAQNAESKLDFLHKMKIAAKEAEETDYWLLLCKRSENYPYNAILHQSLSDLLNIIAKIIISTKRSIRN